MKYVQRGRGGGGVVYVSNKAMFMKACLSWWGGVYAMFTRSGVRAYIGGGGWGGGEWGGINGGIGQVLGALFSPKILSIFYNFKSIN